MLEELGFFADDELCSTPPPPSSDEQERVNVKANPRAAACAIFVSLHLIVYLHFCG
jgi:hypothetical protein